MLHDNYVKYIYLSIELFNIINYNETNRPWNKEKEIT